MMSQEFYKDHYLISTDPTKLDLDLIHDYLAHSSYWAHNIPREVVIRSISNSLSFGLFDARRQVGFARVITDRATYAYLADLFIIEEYRGRGLAKWLMECIMAHPELQGLRRFSLVTRDAHGLYRRYGFRELEHPERHLERVERNVYGGSCAALKGSSPVG